MPSASPRAPVASIPMNLVICTITARHTCQTSKAGHKYCKGNGDHVVHVWKFAGEDMQVHLEQVRYAGGVDQLVWDLLLGDHHDAVLAAHADAGDA